MALKAILLLSALYVLVKLCSTQHSTNKVLVGVYYETHCPDSKDFIRSQLMPAFLKIGDIMSVQLVPFGKATYHDEGGSIKFTCQHGEKECRGNMLQSCAKHIYKNEFSKVLSLVFCMEKERSPEKSVEKCAEQASLNATVISACADSDEGKRYLLEEGKLTKELNPPLTFVPWITINNVYTAAQQKKALNDLRTLVCNVYKGPSIPDCNNTR